MTLDRAEFERMKGEIPPTAGLGRPDWQADEEGGWRDSSLADVADELEARGLLA